MLRILVQFTKSRQTTTTALGYQIKCKIYLRNLNSAILLLEFYIKFSIILNKLFLPESADNVLSTTVLVISVLTWRSNFFGIYTKFLYTIDINFNFVKFLGIGEDTSPCRCSIKEPIV